MLKKVFILLIKFMPVIQMMGILFNNTLYYFDINNTSYIFDFIFGNSIICSIMLYVCSIVFGFCIWHRLIITANIINVGIAYIDCIYKLPISDVELLVLYHLISAIFIIAATIIHIKTNDERRKAENNKRPSKRSYC